MMDGWNRNKNGTRKKQRKKSLSKSNCYMIDRLLVIFWEREEKSDVGFLSVNKGCIRSNTHMYLVGGEGGSVSYINQTMSVGFSY